MQRFESLGDFQVRYRSVFHVGLVRNIDDRETRIFCNSTSPIVGPVCHEFPYCFLHKRLCVPLYDNRSPFDVKTNQRGTMQCFESPRQLHVGIVGNLSTQGLPGYK